MDKDEIKNIITTFVINDFHLVNNNRPVKNCLNVIALKYDKLGAQILYSFLFIKGDLIDSVKKSHLQNSKTNSLTPIIVSETKITDDCINYTYEEFSEKIGGLVNTGLILLDNISEIIYQLGHHELPIGLDGTPDELLEIYVKEILQFLLTSPAKRYGSDRRFESLPDGIVLGKDLIIQFDSKSYSSGFGFSLDDIERFSKYVNDFNRRYSGILNRVFSFVVVTGKFNDSEESIENRKKTFYQKCQTSLSCIDCNNLSSILNLVKRNLKCRESIDWKEIFSNTIITKELLEKEIKRISKDNII